MKSREILPKSILLILVLFLFPACGKKGPLRMPEIVVPQAIKDLMAKAEGNAIIMNFSVPTKNTDGSPLNDLRGFKVLRSMRKLDEGCENCPRKFIPLIDIEYQQPSAQLPTKGEKKEFRDTNLSYGTEYQYKLLSYNSHEDFSRESNVAKAFFDIPPSPPQGLKVDAGDRRVNLSWKEVEILSDGSPSREPILYNCYRTEEGKQFPFEPVNEKPVEVTSYQDVELRNDQKYTFRIHAVRKVGDGWVESEGSSIVSATPVDLIAPTTPLGLTAFWTEGGISLRWEGSPEMDVLCYNIYRRAEGEANYQRVNTQPLKETIWLDTKVTHDKVYFYAISAVDSALRRNESPLSEEVKVIYFP